MFSVPFQKVWLYSIPCITFFGQYHNNNSMVSFKYHFEHQMTCDYDNQIMMYIKVPCYYHLHPTVNHGTTLLPYLFIYKGPF